MSKGKDAMPFIQSSHAQSCIEVVLLLLIPKTLNRIHGRNSGRLCIRDEKFKRGLLASTRMLQVCHCNRANR